MLVVCRSSDYEADSSNVVLLVSVPVNADDPTAWLDLEFVEASFSILTFKGRKHVVLFTVEKKSLDVILSPSLHAYLLHVVNRALIAWAERLITVLQTSLHLIEVRTVPTHE